MIITFIPVAATIVGALVYGFSSNAKVSQLGFGTYVAGLAITLLDYAHVVVGK